jgi:hypothetical protein
MKNMPYIIDPQSGDASPSIRRLTTSDLVGSRVVDYSPDQIVLQNKHGDRVRVTISEAVIEERR